MMSVLRQKSPWLILLMTSILLLGIATEEISTVESSVNVTESEVKTNTTKDLDASESADPKKIEIIKQIRKLNDDGSYTVGYEAEDGTFKIESRDVQGNVKGTFGYIDPNGEIKRVSYSTSNTSQPSIPSIVTPTQTVRTNRTSLRRGQPTLIYPKTSSPTKPTVIQTIPRRKLTNTVSSTPTVTTTESYRVVSRVSPNMNMSESENQKNPLIFTRTTAETLKSALLHEESNDERIAAGSNNTSNVLKSSLLFDKLPEQNKEFKPARANTFRRQLGTSHYDHGPMYAFQQSAGDDTTDVYGGSIALGTPRPLFTTTTGRPKLLRIHNIIASRNNILDQSGIPQVHEDQQESTLEATTNKIGDEKFVTSNPVPILQYPTPHENIDPRVLERPFIRPSQQIPLGPIPAVHFKTKEFLRDHPGSPIPIGNQRVLFRYNPNIQVDRNAEYVAHHGQSVTPPNIVHVVNRPPIQHMENPEAVPDNKQNVVAIPIYEGNQPRFPVNFNPYNNYRENPYVPQRIQIPVIPITQQVINEISPISAPVSTRDLKVLLQQLLVRQNRLQTLIDIREGLGNPGPPYRNPYAQQPSVYENDYRNQKPAYTPRPVYPQQFSEARQYNSFAQQAQYDPYQASYQNQVNQYQGRNDYRAQDDSYRNEVGGFEPGMHYESQRFVPRRRYYGRQYNARYEDVNSGNENVEQDEYLPPEVREALLLKMLMLAINPDFNTMSPDSALMMTTPVPEFRKKVRNVQILGEETDTKEIESKTEKRML